MSHLWIFCVLELLRSTLISPPVVRGTLEGNNAYTSGVNKTSTGAYSASGGGMLSILRQDIRGDKKLIELKPHNLIGGGSTALLRWQLIDKNYYCVLYSAGGVTDYDSVYRTRARLQSFPLPMLEAGYAEGINAADREKRRQEYLNAWGGHYIPFLGSLMHANHDESDAVKKQIYYDIWARGNRLWELYVAEPHRGNRLTREDFHPLRENRGVEQGKRIWETVGEWTFDWTGPFYVTANGEDRYFVTDTGRVFAAPRGAKAGTPLKEIWKDKPVDALIHDADSKKWYAFTKDEYFEVSDPIKPKPHTIDIRRSKIANEALETAAKCGRVIRGLPEPKKEK